MGFMSRRQLSLASLLATVAALIVGACGGGSSNTPAPVATATKAPVAATATPIPAPTAVPTPTAVPVKRGGTLKLRITMDPQPWNVLQGPVTTSFPVFLPVLSTLVQLDRDAGKITPDLAQSWSTSGDGKTITFKLRPGVTWHDGAPLKAADVKVNLDAVFFKTLGFTSHLQGFFTAADSTAAPDDSTVVVTLKQPSNSFFQHFTHPMFANYAPQVSQTDLATGKVVGSNAYTWTNWQKGVQITERAYPKYNVNGVDGKALPYMDELDWFIIPDSTADLAAFRTGKLDVFDQLDAAALTGHLDELSGSIPGLSIAGKSYDSWRMVIVKNRPPFDNVLVRQALNIGIDRQAFVDAALSGAGVAHGYALVAKDLGGLWAPSSADLQKLPGMNPATRQQDLAQASALLKQAGYDENRPLKATMYVVASGVFPTEATVALAGLNAIKGLKIDLVPEESAKHNQRLVLNGDFDLIYRPFALTVDDPSDTIGLFWTSTASRNYSGWNDPTIDQLFNEEETTTDANLRAQDISKLLVRVYDQAYNVFLAWGSTSYIGRPDVKGVPGGGSYANHWRYDKAWLNR
ncbi:MAG: hypothetical protein HY261_01990 [Chloroflexi bacterium]|nr:hypothetical protein [Chloroflexota bacterium]